MIPATRRDRFLHFDLRMRLGSLAADLARIASASKIPAVPAVNDLLEESRVFIELTAPDLLPNRVDDAARLADMGREVTYWFHAWQHLHGDSAAQQKLAEQAQAWSDEILTMSGLLESE